MSPCWTSGSTASTEDIMLATVTLGGVKTDRQRIFLIWKFNVAIEAANTFDVDNWSSKKSSIQNPFSRFSWIWVKAWWQIYLSIGQIIDQYKPLYSLSHRRKALARTLAQDWWKVKNNGTSFFVFIPRNRGPPGCKCRQIHIKLEVGIPVGLKKKSASCQFW